MITGFAILALLLAGSWTTAAAPAVNRAALEELEKGFDQQIERHSPDEPFYLLGNTRGVYLQNYGVVFTAELNLVAGAVVTPFRPVYTREEVARLRTKKLARLAVLKDLMRQMLIVSARGLQAVPPDEQIVLGVTLFAYSWEDSNGLPAQVVMQASRRTLAGLDARRATAGQLAAAIEVKEF